MNTGMPKVQDALGYLEKVKHRFATKPTVYNQFLDIMKDFKSQTIDTEGVINRVKDLFRGDNQLILGFNQFLPPGYKIEVEEKPTIEFNHAVEYVAKIKHRFKDQPEIYGEFLDILHDYQAKRTIDEVYKRVQKLFGHQPDLLHQFKYFLPDTTVGSAGGGRQNISAVPGLSQSSAKGAEKRFLGKRGREKELPAQIVEFPQGTEAQQKCLERIKASVSRSHWAQMVKVLQLYTLELVSRDELQQMLGSILSSKPEHLSRLVDVMGWKDWKEPPSASWPRSRLDPERVKKCFRVSHSYRKLTSGTELPLSSGSKEKLAQEVLNTCLFSCPVVGVTRRLLSRHEECLFQVEDQRHEVDMMIENNRAAMKALEPSVRQIAHLEPERAQLLQLGQLQRLNALHLRAVARLYDSNGSVGTGAQMIEHLRKCPGVVIPLVFDRLKQKDVEWRQARCEMQGKWRELMRQHARPSLDRRSFLYKTQEVTRREPAVLVRQLRRMQARADRRQNNRRRRKQEAGKEQGAGSLRRKQLRKERESNGGVVDTLMSVDVDAVSHGAGSGGGCGDERGEASCTTALNDNGNVVQTVTDNPSPAAAEAGASMLTTPETSGNRGASEGGDEPEKAVQRVKGEQDGGKDEAQGAEYETDADAVDLEDVQLTPRGDTTQCAMRLHYSKKPGCDDVDDEVLTLVPEVLLTLQAAESRREQEQEERRQQTQRELHGTGRGDRLLGRLASTREKEIAAKQAKAVHPWQLKQLMRLTERYLRSSTPPQTAPRSPSPMHTKQASAARKHLACRRVGGRIRPNADALLTRLRGQTQVPRDVEQRSNRVRSPSGPRQPRRGPEVATGAVPKAKINADAYLPLRFHLLKRELEELHGSTPSASAPKLMFANDAMYVYFRLHHLLYERLCRARSLANDRQRDDLVQPNPEAQKSVFKVQECAEELFNTLDSDQREPGPTETRLGPPADAEARDAETGEDDERDKYTDDCSTPGRKRRRCVRGREKRVVGGVVGGERGVVGGEGGASGGNVWSRWKGAVLTQLREANPQIEFDRRLRLVLGDVAYEFSTIAHLILQLFKQVEVVVRNVECQRLLRLSQAYWVCSKAGGCGAEATRLYNRSCIACTGQASFVKLQFNVEAGRVDIGMVTSRPPKVAPSKLQRWWLEVEKLVNAERRLLSVSPTFRPLLSPKRSHPSPFAKGRRSERDVPSFPLLPFLRRNLKPYFQGRKRWERIQNAARVVTLEKDDKLILMLRSSKHLAAEESGDDDIEVDAPLEMDEDCANANAPLM